MLVAVKTQKLKLLLIDPIIVFMHSNKSIKLEHAHLLYLCDLLVQGVGLHENNYGFFLSFLVVAVINCDGL